MRVSDVQDALRKSIVVTRHDIAVAKAYIVGHFQGDVSRLHADLLKDQDAQLSMPVSWDESGDPEPQLSRLICYCQWYLAAYQAVWELVGEGVIIPASGLHDLSATIGYTTPRYGGGWSFTGDHLTVPARVVLAPSFTYRAKEPLVDEQLYLTELSASEWEPDVHDALRDAVRCFRHELYLPCLAMLASATERAWIRTGLALVGYARTKGGYAAKTLDDLAAGFQSPLQSIMVTCNDVLRLYDRSDVFGDVQKGSERRLDALQQVYVWSNLVRDGRNALHYDAEPTLANSYTKTAVLLMAAADHHQTLYAIRRVAQKQVEQTSPPK